MLGKVVHEFEETAIAVMLGVMTLLTFVNVIMRYVFNSMVIWGLEVVLILFAWLVLFGIAYAFKVTANLGVDAIISVVSPRTRYILALLSAACCLAYAPADRQGGLGLLGAVRRIAADHRALVPDRL